MGNVTSILALRLRSDVVRIARGNLGYGEEEGNNDGPLLRAIGGQPGHEWCALFAGYCYRKALLNVGMSDSWCWRNEDAGTLRIGAKEFIKAAWGAGAERFTDPHLARPGDLLCWHRRTGPISWKGHIGIVEEVFPDGRVETIEGNVGAFPAKVKRLVHDVTRERFYGFAGFR